MRAARAHLYDRDVGGMVAVGRKAARRGHCARRRVSERNRRTAAALSAEIDPSLQITGR